MSGPPTSFDVGAPYRAADDNYDAFFAVLDELAAEEVEPLPDVLAEAVASSMGLPWRRPRWAPQSVEVCLTPRRRPRTLAGRTWRVLRRALRAERFVRLEASYVTVDRHFYELPWGGRRPLRHSYTLL